MPELSGLPYFEAQFDRDGNLNPGSQAQVILDGLASARPTDLVVIAHGWNNDMEDARQLYSDLFAQVGAVLAQHPLGGARRLAVLGLLWPSKKFTDRELIPGGGAAGLGSGSDDQGDVATARLEAGIDRLKAVARSGAPDLEQAKPLLDRLEHDAAARREFVALIRDSLDPATGQDPRLAYEASAGILDRDAEDLFRELRAPLKERPRPSGAGGAAGGVGSGPTSGPAGRLGSVFASAKAAAERLLNLATYYQMKERAGRVGSAGAAELLRTIRQTVPALKIHLVGHSFGARLVTAATDRCGGEVKFSSMLLLQAAFSHNSFAPAFQADGKDYVGAFRKVVETGDAVGPILVTHTVHDKAVGIAYAIASRLARQVASDIGDADDIYGGLGRNGALRLQQGAQSLELLGTGGAYDFSVDKVFNLKADRFIADHGDVRNEAVAYALVKMVAAT